MPTHTFTIKITTGKRTELDVSALSCAVNDKQIDFINTLVSLKTSEMENLIESSLKKSIKEYVNKHNNKKL